MQNVCKNVFQKELILYPEITTHITISYSAYVAHKK